MLLHRSINIWCQFGQKCLFRGSASTEVGGPQLLWALFQWQKSASHAKFDQDRTSGSWVMQSYVQKTSNAHPPLRFLEDDPTANQAEFYVHIWSWTSNSTFLGLLEVLNFCNLTINYCLSALFSWSFMIFTSTASLVRLVNIIFGSSCISSTFQHIK